MKGRSSQRIVMLVCIILFIVLFGNGVYILHALNSREKRRYSSDDSRTRIGSDYIKDESSLQQEEPVNLLILGLDDEEVRSDVILLVNYSPSGGGINLLSIPRDTRVYVKGKAVKFNALISIGGERLTIKGVEKLTGLDIKYYATMNFAGFARIVDALDGVEFDVPFDMDYDDPDQNLHIHLKKGLQVLDGKKAEQLVRYRKGNKRREGYEDGDIGRIKMQQVFLKEMIRQKARLKYISRADDVFRALNDSLATNIGIGDLRYYIQHIHAIKSENVKTYTLQGDTAYIGEISYFINNRKESLRMIEDNFYK